jgi:UDP-N-acetylmuramoyl-tripeptide--D-alanyl-D-alanine ligase
MTAEQVLTATGGTVIAGAPPVEFSGVSTDSRTVSPGALFVALRGERHDGHAFAGEALRRGAAAALVSRPLVGAAGCLILVPDTLQALGQLAAAHRAQFALPVIAVTGSTGKTTTKEMTAAILQRRGRALRTEENFNNEIGVPMSLLGLDRDTDFAVIELAMRGAGQIAYLARIARPGIGVITNIGPSHLELLGSLEAVAAAKAELLEALPPDGTAVVNADDAYADLLRGKSAARVVTFGVERRADVRAHDVTQDDRAAARFRLVAPAGEIAVALGVPGRANVHNALAAAAAALAAGAALEDVAGGLARIAPGRHRLEIIEAARGFTIVDDCYNASPASVAMALEVLAALPGRRKFAALGDMRELGPAAEPFHREIGEQAARLGLERLITVGQLGRAIAEGAQAALGERAEWQPDNDRAAERLLALLGPGDVVLVKGSRAMGMEAIVRRLASG